LATFLLIKRIKALTKKEGTRQQHEAIDVPAPAKRAVSTPRVNTRHILISERTEGEAIHEGMNHQNGWKWKYEAGVET